MSSSKCHNAVRRPTSARTPASRRSVRPKLECLEGRIVPSTFVVTNLNDAGAGSLRDAILRANVNPGRDRIVLSPATIGTINLTSGLPRVSEDLELVGPGAAKLKVHRFSGATESMLWVNKFVGVTLSGMTLSGGNSFNGGAIHNEGTLTVNDCVFSGNQSSFIGGAIQNSTGALRVNRSVFSRNSAGSGGGAIYSDRGVLNVSDCTFADNTSASGGGAIATEAGTADIFRSRFNANFAARGGALMVDGVTQVRHCTLAGNGTTGFGDGGAIFAKGMVEVDSSTLSGNAADSGGGIYKVSGNLTLTNCTLAANRARTSGGGGELHGGERVDVTNCTIVGNSVTGTSGFGDFGGGIANWSGLLQLRNSIVWGNSALNGPDVDGQLTSLGFNLLGALDADAATGLVASDRLGVDPMLGPLQNNGGPTPTMALLPGSPAIHGGTTDGAPGTDQRGTQRDLRPDIGAFENDTTRPAAPVVTNPRGPTNSRGATYVLRGRAEPGCRVLVYTDLNNNGRIDGADRLVAQVQLAPGATEFSVSVPLRRYANAANNFLVKAVDAAGNHSALRDVPTITEKSVRVRLRQRGGNNEGFVDVFNVHTGALQWSKRFASNQVNAQIVDLDRNGSDEVQVRWFERGRWFVKRFDGGTGALLS